MKRLTLLSAIMAIALAISLAATAGAKPLRSGNPGGGPGMGGIGGMRVLMNLDLSQDQKQAVYDILQKYADEQQATRNNLRSLKSEFLDFTALTTFNEEKIRQSFRELAPALEDAYVLRAQVHAEIMAVLTSDQLDELQEIRSERARRHEKGNNGFRRAVLETWLTMDSEQ